MSEMGKGQGENPAYILTLADSDATDVSRLGGKAANLAKMAAAGFPVMFELVNVEETPRR
jgi:phosphoenolpyruvate synthase/pyruvate phosphate dikinase